MPAGTLPATTPALAGAQLVEAAQANSQEAWGQIFDSCYPKIYQYCYLRTNSAAAAEDLASEVFLEALRGIHRYEHRGVPLLAWLYRIARNVTADHIRRTLRWRMVPMADDSLESADRADGTLLRHDMFVAISQLTDDQQQVIVLRFFQGFSSEETAALMRRRSSAVRSLQHRALGALRRILIGPSGR
jgi:RNA polymerase sigma-70 factor (ECF subfamily)